MNDNIDYFTLEIRRDEKEAEKLLIAEGMSAEEASAFAKGVTAGLARCDEAELELVDGWTAIKEPNARIEATVVDIVADALSLSPEQRAYALGFVSGVRRHLRYIDA